MTIANEGQFPKADGDYLFATEANRLAFLDSGSFFLAASGTAFQEVGSILILPTGQSDPFNLRILFYSNPYGADDTNVRFELSGIGQNQTVTALNTQANIVAGEFTALLGGSGGIGGGANAGHIQIISQSGGNVTATSLFVSHQGANNFDTGTDTVVKFFLQSQESGTILYTAEMGRGRVQ